VDKTAKLGVPKPVTGSQPGAALKPVKPQHPCLKYMYIRHKIEQNKKGFGTWLSPWVTSKKAVGCAA
jgi:hypothetical protein